jgi:hypothetical protein
LTYGPSTGGSSFLVKTIDLNQFRRFEYEYEYEHREAEYEKAELSTTKTPEELLKINAAYGLSLGVLCGRLQDSTVRIPTFEHF